MKCSLSLGCVVVIAVATASATTYAQVIYNASVIPVRVEGNGCPADADVQIALSDIRSDVREILSNLTSEAGGMTSYSCGGTSGWHRIVFFNMTDPTERCPSAWREVNTSTVVARACGGVALGDRACDSSTFPNIDGVEYNQVCGRMVGYQSGAPDAFWAYHVGAVRSIEGTYLDGVSLTHGPAGSRQHIWSFGAGTKEQGATTADECPCDTTATTIVPPFVGDDYFCEAVLTSGCSSIGDYIGDDPLWDGMNCIASSSCCEFNAPPYFAKTLPSATTDDIEVRLCSYDAGCSSDVAVNLIEIYVK